ncbi:unnamed protein product [Fraxinus pennsylvanica]|uniref:Protein kinase domain-containing protein n=1 Tax=Fraxinus pennsylvanica TaxID=56036 RepID=A0AAD2A692_9LAMI|nr:unnamed protein product [Fraxinus pennsylvanica]
MFLVYNFLSGGNLETFIHQRSGMDKQWSTIYKIATDIKPSNILLDEELNAYLSDFGLAMHLEVLTSSHSIHPSPNMGMDSRLLHGPGQVADQRLDAFLSSFLLNSGNWDPGEFGCHVKASIKLHRGNPFC